MWRRASRKRGRAGTRGVAGTVELLVTIALLALVVATVLVKVMGPSLARYFRRSQVAVASPIP
jgi:hypothetical protein